VRLFLAVDPDNAARELLRGQLEALRRKLREWEACVRWTDAGAAHLTLRFLGETSAATLPALIDALGSRIALPPFETELDGVGVFAQRGRVRTLWLSVGSGRRELRALHAEIAGRLGAGGWPEDEREFTPHLTVGRVRDQYARQARGLAAALADVSIRPVRWRVDRVTLYSSDLSGPRPVYASVYEVGLSESV